MRQDNTIYNISIKMSFSSIGQDKSKLQKQISKLLILTATAVTYLFVLYLKNNLLSKFYILYCLVSLNSFFLTLVVSKVLCILLPVLYT